MILIVNLECHKTDYITYSISFVSTLIYPIINLSYNFWIYHLQRDLPLVHYLTHY